MKAFTAVATLQDIASHVQGRNHTQCLQRWSKVLAPGLRKGVWGVDEDDELVALVSSGMDNWADVSLNIAGRT